jgi:hypothetical protein
MNDISTDMWEAVQTNMMGNLTNINQDIDLQPQVAEDATQMCMRRPTLSSLVRQKQCGDNSVGCYRLCKIHVFMRVHYTLSS